MGRFVKNHEIKTGSHAVRMPLGTTEHYLPGYPFDVTPQHPVTGQIKFNTTLGKLEVYYSNSWHEVISSKSKRVPVVKHSFDGDGVTTSFLINSSQQYVPGDEAMVLVFVGNIYQDPGVVYTFSSDPGGASYVNFTEAPPLGTKVIVISNLNSLSTFD